MLYNVILRSLIYCVRLNKERYNTKCYRLARRMVFGVVNGKYTLFLLLSLKLYIYIYTYYLFVTLADV